jgi:adenylyltransferase/sulfurtransferase
LTILDVRNPQEWEIARLPGALLIPLPELQDRMGELDPADTIVVHCHHGPRSARATNFLRQMGFSRAINLAGGIDAWSVQVDGSVPRY